MVKLSRFFAQYLVPISIGVALGPVSPAHAQSNTVQAESLYQEGKRLMNEHKFDLACPKFEESYKLDPATGTLINLAACHDGAGRYATAWAYYNDALAAAKREQQDNRVRYANEQLRAIEDKLTRLQIELSPGANVPGLEVRLDGQLLSPGLLGVASPVDPGHHVIDVTAPGKKATRIEVDANKPKAVVRAVVPVLEDQPAAASPGEPTPAPAATTPSPAVDAPRATSGGNGLTTFGIVSTAVGVVGIGAGIVFNLSARSDVDRAGDHCTAPPDGNTCTDRDDQIGYQDAVSAAETKATLSYVGFGVGGAALAAGITLLILGRGDDRESPPVALTLTERSLGFSARGSW